MTTNNITKTVTIVSTVESLLGAYRSHVLGRNLPEPSSVSFVSYERQIDVQTGGHRGLCAELSRLLVWACTLVDVTAEWWHTPGGSLHVTVLGRTAGGTRIKTYTGSAFAECQGLVPLAVGESEGVSLDELYTLAGLLREAHEHQEVA